MRLLFWTCITLVGLYHFNMFSIADHNNMRVLDLTTTGPTGECKKFKCKQPRPERFWLHKIVPSNKGEVPTKEFVLYRCRPSSGCCDYLNLTCSFSNHSNVCVKFDFEPLSKRKLIPQFIVVPNHTECSCTSHAGPEKKESYPMQDFCPQLES